LESWLRISADPSESVAGEALVKPVHKRTPRRPSRERPFWADAQKIGLQWLIDNGCPVAGDGNQAELERHVTDWLEDHGHEASESAVRRHVVSWIEEQRKALNAEGSSGSPENP
jgi:hypothetical protein